jgi:hypothetical protein
MPYVEYDEVAAICPECGRMFRSEDDLRTHKEEVHAQPATAAAAPRPAPHPPHTSREIAERAHRGRRAKISR